MEVKNYFFPSSDKLTERQSDNFSDCVAWESRFKEFLQEHPTYADSAHDLSHTQRVVNNAKFLAHREGALHEVVLPAAWWHDCVQLPKNHPDRSNTSKLAAHKAREWLAQVEYPQRYHEPILHAIEAHSFTAKIVPRTLEAKIVQDADRLDALGAIGIARVFTTGGALQRPLYNCDDPFVTHREADDLVFTLDHFYVKLLRIADTLHTQSARKEGARRKDFMLAYLRQLAGEIPSAVKSDMTE